MYANRREAIRLLGSGAVGLTLPSEDCLPRGLCASEPELAGFTSLCFSDLSKEKAKHPLYVTGDSGPPVLLLHEINGLTNETLETARKLAGGGYTVIVPLLFGRPGVKSGLGSAGDICGDELFACKRGDRTSKHVDWLCDLAACVKERWTDGQGVGAIGMCLTGAFPLAMLRSPAVVAPVLCQPTLPFSPHNLFHFLGWFTDQKALAIAQPDLDYAKQSTSMPILGLRYEGDRFCKARRFERLTGEFPQRFHRLDFPGRHHSTLVGDFCPDALNEVLAFFSVHLRKTPDSKYPKFPVQSRISPGEVVPHRCVAPTGGAGHTHA